MNIYEKIKKKRIELGMTQEELAEKTGYKSRSSINKIENGQRDISRNQVEQFAAALNVTPSYLMGWEEGDVVTSISIPLYGNITCGNLSFVDEEILEMIALPSTMLNSNKKYFSNYAKGDSMIGVNIYENNLIVFQETNVLNNGDIGAFCVNGEYTCKKYMNVKNTIMLIPANESYEPIIVNKDDDFRILGKKVLVISK